MNKSKKLLQCSLFVISTITTINTAIMYWCPTLLPCSSFLISRLTFVALATRMYFFVAISLLMCVFLFVLLMFIYKRYSWPIIALISYFSIELCGLIYLLAYNIICQKYFMWFYVGPIIINIFFITLCIVVIKKNRVINSKNG